MGIGENTVIERAIVDKNSRVGSDVRIVNEGGLQEADADGYYIRDGIVIVPKGGVIPDGTVIGDSDVDEGALPRVENHGD